MTYSIVTHGTVPGGANGGTSAGLNTTGSTLLVFITDQYVGGPAVTVSDSNSNTWTGRTSKTSGEPQVRIWESKNPTVGSGHTFATNGSGIYCSGVILAFSGADTTAPFDVENGNTASSGTTIQPGSVTPGQNDSLIVSGIGTGPGTTISSINSSYTITDTVNYSAGTNEGVSGAYLIQTSLGATNPTWTISNPVPQGFAAVIAVYKPSTGAGSQNLTPSLFTNSNTFFGPIVAPGAVNLSPSFFTDPDTFFGPTVGRGAVALAPSLFTNAGIFFSPTVTVAGAQALSPSLFTNNSIFYLPVVRSHIVLVNVWVKLLEPHEFDARVWPKNTVFGPDQSTIPADFNYTPLMQGYSSESIAAIAQVKIDVWGRYDSHGNLLDNPPIPRPIWDPQPTTPVGNKHLLPLGNTC